MEKRRGKYTNYSREMRINVTNKFKVHWNKINQTQKEFTEHETLWIFSFTRCFKLGELKRKMDELVLENPETKGLDPDMLFAIFCGNVGQEFLIRAIQFQLLFRITAKMKNFGYEVNSELFGDYKKPMDYIDELFEVDLNDTGK